MSELVLSIGFPYGAPDLERTYRKNLANALLLGIAFAYSLVGCYWGGVYFLKDGNSSPPLIKMKIEYVNLRPPPSIAGTNAPPITVATLAVKPSTGIPVPVPDAEVNSERTFVTPQEMNALGETSGEGTRVIGGGENIEAPIQIQDDSPPPKFVIVEKTPVIIKRVQPVYPEIARKAGIEGTVWVELWITKKGKVKKGVVIKSTSDIFNQPTLDAAMQFVFTPAIMQNGPVAVWVTMPFHYRLK
ncbi:energy transducer TonB [candidate division KSB1 bacterium]|nr:energy transducer TonB [candidate division KSB1 bacterium]